MPEKITTIKEIIHQAKSLYGKNEIEANLHLRQAAKFGSAEAYLELSQRYIGGIPMADLDEARACLRQASLLGLLKAKYVLKLHDVSLDGDEGMSDLTSAIEQSAEIDNWDAVSQLSFLSGYEGPISLDKESVPMLEFLAGIGDSLAAMDLSEGYEAGQFNDVFEAEPVESLRWSLIERLLSGVDDLKAYVEECTSISSVEKENVVLSVQKWIHEHPLARQAAFEAWYRKRFLEVGGPVSCEEFPGYYFYKPSCSD